MASEAPPFWWERPDWRAWVLAPVSAAYGAIAARRMERARPKAIDLPVLCVGNLTVGGGGKTPTCVAIAQAARKMKLTPGVVTRGYGGINSGVHLVDADHDLARHVGDEPMLIARHARVAVSANRLAAAQLLKADGCDFIIMDDGFQSMRLKSDFNLIVVDARRGVGNGHVIPAGPLRAPVVAQMRHGDALLKLGDGEAADALVRQAAKAGKAVYVASTVPAKKVQLAGKRVLAFAGIADPDKFFETLVKNGAHISLARSFPDHHYFADDELSDLLQAATAGDLLLVTTEKDAMRLSGGSDTARKMLDATVVFRIDVAFEQSDAPQRMIAETLENFRRRQLGQI